MSNLPKKDKLVLLRVTDTHEHEIQCNYALLLLNYSRQVRIKLLLEKGNKQAGELRTWNEEVSFLATLGPEEVLPTTYTDEILLNLSKEPETVGYKVLPDALLTQLLTDENVNNELNAYRLYLDNDAHGLMIETFGGRFRFIARLVDIMGELICVAYTAWVEASILEG